MILGTQQLFTYLQAFTSRYLLLSGLVWSKLDLIKALVGLSADADGHGQREGEGATGARSFADHGSHREARGCSLQRTSITPWSNPDRQGTYPQHLSRLFTQLLGPAMLFSITYVGIFYILSSLHGATMKVLNPYLMHENNLSKM